jgi:hypothetical protein
MYLLSTNFQQSVIWFPRKKGVGGGTNFKFDRIILCGGKILKTFLARNSVCLRRRRPGTNAVNHSKGCACSA